MLELQKGSEEGNWGDLKLGHYPEDQSPIGDPGLLPRSSPISGSRPRVPIPPPPGPLRAPPETSSPTSLPKRDTRPQRLAALRLGAPAPPLVARLPTASGPPHAAACPSRAPALFLDRVFIRAMAWASGRAPRVRRSENAVYVA